MANGQETGIETLRRVIALTARRNDWNSVRGLHQGPRSLAASEAVYMTAPRSACRNTKKTLAAGGRGRDGDYSPPPAQNPAGAANAPGSHLGW